MGIGINDFENLLLREGFSFAGQNSVMRQYEAKIQFDKVNSKQTFRVQIILTPAGVSHYRLVGPKLNAKTGVISPLSVLHEWQTLVGAYNGITGRYLQIRKEFANKVYNYCAFNGAVKEG